MKILIPNVLKHNFVKYGKLNILYVTVQDIVSKSTRLVIIDHSGSGGTKQRFSRSGTATLFSKNGEKFIALCQHQLSDMGSPNSNDINMLRIVSEDKKFNAIPVERAFYLKNMKDEETADLLVLKVNTEHKHWRAIDAPYFTPLTTRNNKTPEVTFAVGFPTEYSPFCDKEYQNLETSDFKSVNLTRECIPCKIDKNFRSDISFFHRCTITDKKKNLDGLSGGAILSLCRNASIHDPEWEIFLDGIIARGGNGYLYYICWKFLNRSNFKYFRPN